jgi:HD-GYP domain-containing protein (c-di-GMP phosphodiesterase class II)
MSSAHIDLFDFITSLARIIDLMCPAVGRHNLQVAYLAYRIGEQLELTPEELYDLAVAGTLHDIGAFSLKEKLDLLQFEDTRPGQHALAGYLLLQGFAPLASAAGIIRHHHLHWEEGEGCREQGQPVPMASHLLHLADRFVVQINREVPVLGQVAEICRAVEGLRGSWFVPEQVDALLQLRRRDYVWLDLVSDSLEDILRNMAGGRSGLVGFEEMLNFSCIISRLIDFKSEFTATHSSGVAACAVALAHQVGFAGDELRNIEIAAYLHDLGKLAVPKELLEKSDILTEEEWMIMRTHVYYTHQILHPIGVLRIIDAYGSLHQERINGSGYPFGYLGQDLPLGARIMAVADVFTAITEDRPYRKGMEREKALATLQAMAVKHDLDVRLVELVREHFDVMNSARHQAQAAAAEQFKKFQNALT